MYAKKLSQMAGSAIKAYGDAGTSGGSPQTKTTMDFQKVFDKFKPKKAAKPSIGKDDPSL